MKYTHIFLLFLFCSFKVLSSPEGSNDYLALNKNTSLKQMDELNGQVYFKVILRYSPCFISSLEQLNDYVHVNLSKCLISNEAYRLPLKASATLINNQRKPSSLRSFELLSGNNKLKIPRESLNKNSGIMELSYD